MNWDSDRPMKACQLLLFATNKTAGQSGSLEERFRAFAKTGDTTEDIDELRDGASGSPPIADYLFDRRSLIAELKTLKSDPASSIERRIVTTLKEAKVHVFGRYGLAPILRGIPEGERVAKELVRVQGRRVRQELRSAAVQISSTRSVLGIEDAAGIVVFLSEASRLMDASSIAYAAKDVLEGRSEVDGQIHYVVAFVESHSIRLPDGSEGYPIVVVLDAEDIRPVPERHFVGTMIESWALWQRRELFAIDHKGSWDALTALEPGPAVRLH